MNFFWNIFALKQREENNSKLFAKQSCQILVLKKRYTAHMQCKPSNSKTKIIYTRFTHPHDVDHMVANMLYITPLCEIISVTIRYSVENFIHSRCSIFFNYANNFGRIICCHPGSNQRRHNCASSQPTWYSWRGLLQQLCATFKVHEPFK